MVVIWTTQHADAPAVYAEALSHFQTVMGVRIHPAYTTNQEKVTALNRFYEDDRRGKNIDDVRGTQPFALIFVKLPSTPRVPCTGGISARGMKECPVTNAFKTQVRRRHHGLVIHATDTTAKMRENVAALGISYGGIAAQRGRVPWSNRSEVLHALEAAGVEYAVTRGWCCVELVPTCPQAWSSWSALAPAGLGIKWCTPDLDLIALDCAAVAWALGPGVGWAPPPSLEVINRTDIKISLTTARGPLDVEVRCPGSGYMDDAWMRAALRRRVAHPQGFSTVGPLDYAFGLVYHDLVQKKRQVLHAHWDMLDRAYQNGFGASQLLEATHNKSSSLAAAALRHYMDAHGYQDVAWPQTPTWAMKDPEKAPLLIS
jgi:hypothetical protein